MEVFIKNQNLTVKINSFGAELIAIYKHQKNYIWEVDAAFWNKTSPILFPTVGRLKNDEYRFKEKTYTLPRHGFARNFDFEIISQEEEGVVFSLKSSAQTLDVYPFHFELRISYHLAAHTLKVTYEVINRSDEKMYYSIGAHPAFAIEGDFEDFSPVFDEARDLETHLLEKELFSGKTAQIPLQGKELPLRYAYFAANALVFKNRATQTLTLTKEKKPMLKVEFSDFPYLGIWTLEKAPFLCIEPWLGIADHVHSTGELTQKEGIQVLESFGERTSSWSVEIF